MKIEFSPPDISDLEILEVIESMKSGWIVTGPRTKLLEKRLAEYCGTSRAACFNSATAALEMVLRMLDIGPGDEVITSPYTYSASAAVIHHVGAKIVLVDTAPDEYGMDMDQLADAITERTKAIIPVDIGGVMCDYKQIFSIVKQKRNLFRAADNKIQRLFGRVIVLADAAHSFGAKYDGMRSGNVADFTCFSFHAVKNLTTAEGGAAVWRDKKGMNNEEVYRALMLYSLHGQTKDALSKMIGGSWEYDIAFPGYKCNMTDILAAMGLAQLSRYEGMMACRKRIISSYDQSLLPCGIDRLEHFDSRHPGNGHLYMTRIPGITEGERNEIIAQMAQSSVATNVHFKPLPLFTGYRNLGFDIADYPNAYAQYANEITLPVHALLSDEQVQYVADTFKSILSKLKYGYRIKGVIRHEESVGSRRASG